MFTHACSIGVKHFWYFKYQKKFKLSKYILAFILADSLPYLIKRRIWFGSDFRSGPKGDPSMFVYARSTHMSFLLIRRCHARTTSMSAQHVV